MAVPSTGEAFSKLIDHLRLAQEDAATLSHLHNDEDRASRVMALGWLAVSEMLKELQKRVTGLATKGRLN